MGNKPADVFMHFTYLKKMYGKGNKGRSVKHLLPRCLYVISLFTRDSSLNTPPHSQWITATLILISINQIKSMDGSISKYLGAEELD